ncbi:hypothetical protein, partial [Salmonella sp. SAL4433]|uniref:hypothetical protein n=1 Tax=Salmonella sp. SAL4433 TaxID=3159888 RepID=UPI00397974D2
MSDRMPRPRRSPMNAALGLLCALAATASAAEVPSGPLTRAQAVQLGLTRNVSAISSRIAAMQAD